MKRLFTNLLTLSLAISIFSCSTEKKVSEAENTASEEKEIYRKGFDNIDELSKALLETLKNKDYNTYYSFVISKEHEKTLGDLIQDKKAKITFRHEFDFSLKEEEDYFNNMVHYLKSDSINLDSASMDQKVVIDYESNKFAPLIMKEVLIPVATGKKEVELTYVTVQVDGKWYLTSELGI